MLAKRVTAERQLHRLSTKRFGLFSQDKAQGLNKKMKFDDN